MAMKQNNFYLRWQKAAGAAKSESRSQGLRTLVPGLAVVAVSMLGWGVLTLHTSMLKSQREDILNWCSDNTEPYRAATQDSESAAQFRSLTDYSDGMTELLNSYPDVTSSLLHRVEAAGGGGGTGPVARDVPQAQLAAPVRVCRRVRHHDPVHRLQRIDGRTAL